MRLNKPLNKEKILHTLLHPLVIAIPFALITILLLPIEMSKIKIESLATIDTDKGGKNTIQYYHDLDQDSIDEEISHFVNDVGQCAIKVSSAEGFYKGQWNFRGSLPQHARSLAYVDVNGDGVLDIFTLFQRNDSVFLGCVDIENGSQKLIEARYIDKLQRINGKTDYSANLSKVDLNGDQHDEVLININAGYSEQPRKIYAYDFVNDTLLVSPIVGFKHSNWNVLNIDGDKYPMIIPNTVSHENIEAGQGIPFHDYDRWLVVYDHKLAFKIAPIKIGQGSGSVMNYVFTKDGQSEVISIDINNESSNKFTFYQLDTQREKLTKISPRFPVSLNMHTLSYHYDNATYLLLYNAESGWLSILDPFDSLKVIQDHNIGAGLTLLRQMDIDGKGEGEILFMNKIEGERSLVVYSADFKNRFVYKIPSHFKQIRNITSRRLSTGETHFIIQADASLLEFNIHIDRFYLLKTLVLIAFIFGFYVLLISIILHYQKKIITAYYRREQELAELKLKSIRSQLDPHFTFNAINAVSAAILREEKDKAYRYFSLFSKLMRSTMLYSDYMTRLLSDELEFTKNYLDIEKFRFREKFNYQINVAPDVNTSLDVPRNIIQTFAESAVSNGLMHRSEGGDLSISLTMEDSHLIAVFIDNGVGTEKAKMFNKEKAFKAVKIMDEFIRIFNQLNHTRISYKMFDLDGGEDFPGTAVEVRIPMGRQS